MSKKNKIPYRKNGSYHAVFGSIQKHRVVTRKQLLREGHSAHDVTVVLSPRDAKQTRKGCDCRGNASASGHLYYMEKLPRRIIKGVKEDQRFRLRWREKAMEPRKRAPQYKIEAKKVSKKTTKKTVKTASKSRAKKVVGAKAKVKVS